MEADPEENTAADGVIEYDPPAEGALGAFAPEYENVTDPIASSPCKPDDVNAGDGVESPKVIDWLVAVTVNDRTVMFAVAVGWADNV